MDDFYKSLLKVGGKDVKLARGYQRRGLISKVFILVDVYHSKMFCSDVATLLEGFRDCLPKVSTEGDKRARLPWFVPYVDGRVSQTCWEDIPMKR